MGLDIGNGTIFFTAYPYRIVRSNRYATKVVLNVPVAIGLDSRHVDLFFRIKYGDLMSDGTTLVIDFLNSLPNSITIANSTYNSVRDGIYYVEACEIRAESKRKGIYDVRLSMFGEY